jgi:hypothetical protein
LSSDGRKLLGHFYPAIKAVLHQFIKQKAAPREALSHPYQSRFRPHQYRMRKPFE